MDGNRKGKKSGNMKYIIRCIINRKNQFDKKIDKFKELVTERNKINKKIRDMEKNSKKDFNEFFFLDVRPDDELNFEEEYDNNKLINELYVSYNYFDEQVDKIKKELLADFPEKVGVLVNSRNKEKGIPEFIFELQDDLSQIHRKIIIAYNKKRTRLNLGKGLNGQQVSLLF